MTGSYAYNFIHGMQGNDEFRLAGAGPKHAFAYDVEQCRHGHVQAGVDCGNANVSQRDLKEFYYPVWEQVARANATSVMCSYSEFAADYSTLRLFPIAFETDCWWCMAEVQTGLIDKRRG